MVSMVTSDRLENSAMLTYLCSRCDWFWQLRINGSALVNCSMDLLVLYRCGFAKKGLADGSLRLRPCQLWLTSLCWLWKRCSLWQLVVLCCYRDVDVLVCSWEVCLGFGGLVRALMFWLLWWLTHLTCLEANSYLSIFGHFQVHWFM
jgi:hypothetical protein